jgi:hypothetical protein
MSLRAILFCAVALTNVEALAQNHAISAKAGALGLGLEYTYSFSDRWAFRLGPYGSSASTDQEEAGIEYEVEIDWDSISLALDFHPFTGPFRLTAGVLQNDNAVLARSTPTEDVDIGGITYTPDQVGTLRAAIGFEDDVAPFVSLGWDWSRTRRFGIALDFGLVGQGTPLVSLSADGTLTGNPIFEASLAAEEAELQDSLSDIDILPFVTLGVVFRF